eukprot:CAMPEP_0201726234 /NCGR_PEP_ID=MMETSP0593-20130828/9335_1 /ASSEMBLY_ACC=CAM_ASM_000672 /TAXON_ID=267983 /ORGANISM="Skeletonema japonicum, Strain CCMP2506" /LENGTH=474 /DNA_ID=CAMNT_0048217705 /DNA_START=62 /DNA_END=1483 /DNA_ORIENTATION=+
MPTNTEWAIALVLPLNLTLAAWYVLSSSSDNNNHNNFTPSYYLKLWCFYFFLDATYGYLLHTILLVPARWIARRLPGAVVPSLSDQEMKENNKLLVEQEESSNDISLDWPSVDAIAKLPPDWIVSRLDASDKERKLSGDDNEGSHSSKSTKKQKKMKTKNDNYKSSSQQYNNTTLSNQKLSNATTKHKASAQQPYYLNHVRGSTRIRQASQRIGAAMGSILASYMICHLSAAKMTLQDVGWTFPWVVQDLAWGFLIGSSIVTISFIMEVCLGWIKIVAFFQTVVPNELFVINFLWDVLFHVGVSINEELMLRGWMFTLGCRGILAMAFDWFEESSTAATFSIIASIILQSSLFSFLHLHSPGSTHVSLLNLFLGGIAASINVMVAGGSLWLGTGWHFGWNIFMGHVLGRSTSGIPMSCACIDVIPRPKLSDKKCYETYHGGTFGPEQGVLAPLAYLIGILLVVFVYGFDGMRVW